MEKQYTVKVTQREPRPRSKRLREQGIGSSAGATVVLNGAGGVSNISTANDHTHENKPTLDQISTDEDKYLYLTQPVETTDPDTGEESVQFVAQKAKAGYADKAGIADTAHNLDADSPVFKQFLSKLADDVAAGHITFEKGLTALLASKFKGGANFGDFVQGFTGANIDHVGNAEFESVESRSYLKVFELIYNRLNALEGDPNASERDDADASETTAPPAHTPTPIPPKTKSLWDESTEEDNELPF